MKDKLILKNGTEIELESGASLGDIRVLFPDMKSMVDAWDEMTEENLSEVTIKNGDGVVIDTPTNLVFENATLTPYTGGAIFTSFHFHKKTRTEIRLDALELEQDIQNGAIGDLGEAVSNMAEEGRLI